MNRVNRFFNAWYVDQRKYRMGREEWLYIGQLTLASIIAFGIGLIIGLVWARFI